MIGITDIHQLFTQRGFLRIIQKICFVKYQILFDFQHITFRCVGNLREAQGCFVQESSHTVHIGVSGIINSTQFIFCDSINFFTQTTLENKPVGVIFNHDEIIFHATCQSGNIIILKGFGGGKYEENTDTAVIIKIRCIFVQFCDFAICQIAIFIHHKLNGRGFCGNGKYQTEAKHQCKEYRNHFSSHRFHLLTAATSDN